jgi:hypothetical protein
LTGLIARKGDPAAGTPQGVLFNGFGQTTLNAAGQVAFHSLLTGVAGSGVDASNNTAIWSGGPGSLRLVAREGDDAPGILGDVEFGDLYARPVINAIGDTTFHSLLRGGMVDSLTDESIWSEGGGALALVAREGCHAPGTPDGAVFGRGFDGSLSAFEASVLNSVGRVAFLGYVTGNGILGSSKRGIWAQDGMGVLRLIAREGDLLEVEPGDFRTIEFLEFVGDSGNEDGRGSGFNDLGQVAFRARFSQGGGIFVFNVAANSEPLLPGDYNDNGAVDAADYVVWRDREGTADPMPNDPLGGTIGAAHYEQWKANFGITAGSGSGATGSASANAAIPEPATCALVIFGALGCVPLLAAGRQVSIRKPALLAMKH